MAVGKVTNVITDNGDGFSFIDIEVTEEDVRVFVPGVLVSHNDAKKIKRAFKAVEAAMGEMDDCCSVDCDCTPPPDFNVNAFGDLCAKKREDELRY